MNPLIKLIIKLFWLTLYLIAFSLVLYFIYFIFDLLGVPITIYGNYLIWIIAMGVFLLTLPQNNKDSIFS
jgi:hypothetical protein